MNIYFFSELTGKTSWSVGVVASAANVFWNPDYHSANPSDPSNLAGSDSTLFHEMAHGSHAMNGVADTTETGDAWDNIEERNTINDSYPAENDYLNDRGFPWARPDHRDTTVPMADRPPHGSHPAEPPPH